MRLPYRPFSDHLTDETARPNAPVGAAAGGGRSGPAAAAAIRRARTPRPTSGPLPTQTGRAGNRHLRGAVHCWRYHRGVAPRVESAVVPRLPFRFRVGEYSVAERAFVAEAIDEVCRRGDPILSQIQVEPSAGPITSRISGSGGESVRLPVVEIAMTMELTGDEVRSGRPESLVAQIAVAAEQQRRALLTYFFASLDTVTSAAGTAISAAGRPFIDAFCEMLESMELSFDEEGQLAPGYQFVLHPDTYARLAPQVAAWTPDEDARVEAVLQRKREEFRARQRRRRLP